MRSRIAFFVLVLIAVLINFPQINKTAPILFIRSSIQILVYPLQWSSTALVGQTQRTLGFFINAKSFKGENIILNEKLSSAEARLLVLERIKTENQSLRSALGFRDGHPYNFSLTPAEVISLGDSMITINRGSDNGVKEGQTVINRSGLIGRVGEVSKYSSKIELITDPVSVISAILPRTGTYGIVRGGGRIIMENIPEGVSVEAGEKVVVSPASASFLRGLPIGKVRSADKKVGDLFYYIEIEPTVDFSKLDIIYICRP